MVSSRVFSRLNRRRRQPRQTDLRRADYSLPQPVLREEPHHRGDHHVLLFGRAVGSAENWFRQHRRKLLKC
jgi:hypothetical protein